MELNEFVRLDPNKIRRDKELMQLYVNFYEAAFSFLPNCVGCSFKTGLKKLARYANGAGKKTITYNQTSKTMERTFTLKNQFKLKILTYKKGGRVHRAYGYNMTEEFAKELVEAGKSEVFAKLPATGSTSEPKGSKYSDMDYRTEIMPLYNEIKDRTGKTAEGKKKTDIIAFLEKYEG